MKLERRKPSGREKDEASIELLERLREKLYSDDISTARRAAFNLSWMQEDGLDILKEALFGAPSRRTKTAAAYGLRCMRGRMKKMAMDALEQGSKRRNIDVRNVCSHALLLMGRRTQGRSPLEGEARIGRFRIREIPQGSGLRSETHRRGRGRRFRLDKDFSQR